MISRLPGAVVRAMIVVLLISTPSLLLADTSPDTRLVTALIAFVAAVFTAIEYNAAAPSLIAFRDAPPFNRMRIGSLFATVFALTVIMRGQSDPSTITRLFEAIGGDLARAMDFPYSPVRLVVLMMPQGTDPAVLATVRIAAGLSYFVSILTLGAFVLLLRLRGWPGRAGHFNVWVNLPVFDPTAGDDVVDRLRHNAQVNLIVGFLLPFMIPAIVEMATILVDPQRLADPHTLIWTMTAWAFLPASLLMRGIALNRVADMIHAQRRRAHADEGDLAHA
ncbi:hypothetical protein [Wenxinia marina]|nr:hypothetical protein [Wenxinia marina]